MLPEECVTDCWYKCLNCQKCFQFPNKLVRHRDQTPKCLKFYKRIIKENERIYGKHPKEQPYAKEYNNTEDEMPVLTKGAPILPINSSGSSSIQNLNEDFLSSAELSSTCQVSDYDQQIDQDDNLTK